MSYRSRRKKRAQDKVLQDEQSITQLVDIIDQDIETIVTMRMRAERNVSRHQRMIERVTKNLGRPRFFYIIVLVVVLWISVNTTAAHLGLPALDAPPFYWLELAISLGALLMTTVILITQNREDKMAEQRRHLDLQINLLVERKVSKIIDLVEELRRDLPSVENRHDPQAEAMKEKVDPHHMLTSLTETLDQAVKELD